MWVLKKRSGKHNIALLFWQSTDSGARNYLERILVEHKGLLIGVRARGSMGSIDLHQSAGLCAQPEAAQDNLRNLLTAITTDTKAVWLCETTGVCTMTTVLTKPVIFFNRARGGRPSSALSAIVFKSRDAST